LKKVAVEKIIFFIFYVLCACSEEASAEDIVEADIPNMLNNNQSNLHPHGRDWAVSGEITFDPNTNQMYSQRPSLQWGQFLTDRTIINEMDYFRLLFPIKFINEKVVPITNEQLALNRQNSLSGGEFITFLGITLAMALQPMRGGIDAYWRSANTSNETVYIHGDFGERFGMSRDRFKIIRRYFRCSRPADTTVVTAGAPDVDPWGSIRPFIEAFNENRRKKVIPGRVLTVDEVMSMWLGLDGNYAVEGIPHLTKIAHKPRGVGAELKAMCDGKSGILMSLELMEGKERGNVKKYHDLYGHGTAVTMRLVQNWAGTGRIVTADSAFSSVKTLVALHKDLGLYFQGIVKTAHREYPKQYLNTWYNEGWDPNPRRDIGSHIVLKVLYIYIYILIV